MASEVSDRHATLRETFAEFFATVATSSAVGAAEPLGFDPAVWGQVVATGAHLLTLPADCGGGGARYLDAAVVAREFGRRLVPAPLIEHMVATGLLMEVGASEGMLAEIVEGAVVATVGLAPARGGVAPVVPAGPVADVAVVLDGDMLVALLRPLQANDSSDRADAIADWALADAGVERRVVAEGAEAVSAWRRARDDWRLLTAAALDGLRSQAMLLGVEHARVQAPGRCHVVAARRLVDAAAAGDAAEALLCEAACARDEASPDAGRLALMAFLHEAEVARRTTRESLQLHGGYGFSRNCDIGHYFRRARAWVRAAGNLGLGHRELTRARDEAARWVT